ncbi:MAG: ribosome-associated translation inhibitor RaiA [Bacteroidota bacterium]
MKIQTEAIDFKVDQKLVDFIDKKIGKLERFHDRILDVRVVLKLENKSSKIKDKIAEIQLQIPGDLLVTKSSDKTFEAAVAEASEAMERSLKKQKTKTSRAK